jgi:hypothetical protein
MKTLTGQRIWTWPWRFSFALVAITVASLGRAVAQLNTYAQTMQVVTKVVEKEISCPDGLTQRIRLNARKADVTIKGWNRPVVGIRLRLVAKHPDRAVAEREVGYHQYVMQLNGAVIDLSNQFVIPQRAGKLQSQLKAIYEVSVPNRAALTISNSFGDVALRNLAGETSINIEFGKLTLDDISGKLTINSDYGDIEGHDINATLFCTAEKANIDLRDLGGNSRIQSRYGKLLIVPSPVLDALRVEAARTDIVLVINRIADFQYDLLATQAEIRVPAAYADQLGRFGGKQTFTLQPPGKKPEISIQNIYSPITIMNGQTVGMER